MQKERKPDVIRRHEQQQLGIDVTSEGTASTSKKIIQKSIDSRKKMLQFDNVFK